MDYSRTVPYCWFLGLIGGDYGRPGFEDFWGWTEFCPAATLGVGRDFSPDGAGLVVLNFCRVDGRKDAAALDS